MKEIYDNPPAFIEKVFDYAFNCGYRLCEQEAMTAKAATQATPSTPATPNLSESPTYSAPKYHKGQKVRYNGYVYEIEGLAGKNRYALKGLNFDLDEDLIEPYTEPTEEASQNVTRSGILTRLANGDLQVRLQVAAMSLQGILANPEYYNKYEKYFESVPIAGSYTPKEKYYAELALSYADALLAESQKGGAKWYAGRRHSPAAALFPWFQPQATYR